MNKVVVGLINSTATVPLQCCLSPCSAKRVKCKKKKKKKKCENTDTAKFSAIRTSTLSVPQEAMSNALQGLEFVRIYVLENFTSKSIYVWTHYVYIC